MKQFTKDKYPFFICPTQVLFYDEDNPDSYISGIAYKDEIICGCCGGIFLIQEVWEAGINAGVQPIYPYENWVSLTEAITGDEAEEALKEPDAYFSTLDDLLENSTGTNS